MKTGDLPRGQNAERAICKWYPVCPMKRYYERGQLDRQWIERYCFGDYRTCARYKMEEAGVPHPDTMLPDGRTNDRLGNS